MTVGMGAIRQSPDSLGADHPSLCPCPLLFLAPGHRSSKRGVLGAEDFSFARFRLAFRCSPHCGLGAWTPAPVGGDPVGRHQARPLSAEPDAFAARPYRAMPYFHRGGRHRAQAAVARPRAQIDDGRVQRVAERRNRSCTPRPRQEVPTPLHRLGHAQVMEWAARAQDGHERTQPKAKGPMSVNSLTLVLLWCARKDSNLRPPSS